MVVLIIIFDLPYPENMLTVYVRTLASANFDVYSTEYLFNQLFGFEQTESYSMKFAETNYDGSNYINLIGPLFLVMIFYPACRILIFIMMKLCTCMRKLLTLPPFAVDAALFAMEGCLELGISAAISVIMTT